MNEIAQTFGDFREDLTQGEQFLMISFSPGSLPLQQLWRNNGLSADFVAEYLATFFPPNEADPNSIQRQAELRSAVSYIANELLENAMKFHDKNSNHPIQFGLYLLQDVAVLFCTNCISQFAMNKLKEVIQTLTTGDSEELYLQHLEKLAETEYNNASGLGLLTIIHDYPAQLGWKFEPIPNASDLITVTTMVQLTV